MAADQGAMSEKYRSGSESETFEIAQALARSVPRPAHILLFGDLGAGKTAFTRGLVAGFGGDPSEVSSPTFTLVNRYDGREAGARTIFHVDLYRLEPEGVPGLDLESAFDDPAAAVIVEWAERLGDLAPDRAIRVSLGHLGPAERMIEVRGPAQNGEQPAKIDV